MKTRSRFTALIFIFVLLVQPLAGVAAQEKAISLHVDWIDTTAFPSVVVNLSAWGADGLPLANLTPGDFTLQEDGGAPFHPAGVQVNPQAALSVGLVLDISESMTGDPIDDAKDAATRFLDRLGPGDRAALIAFSDGIDPDPGALNPSRELDFSADLDPVFDLVEGLQADGQTHLYNAAAKAVGLAAGEQEGHRAILLLTDGRNEPADLGDPEEAIRLAQAVNVPFFVIGLGNQIDEPYLRRLANETGGLFRAAPTSSELAHLFTDMAALLKTQYQLTFESALPADGGTHTLNVTLNAAGGADTQSLEFGPLPLTPPTEVPPTDAPTLQPSPTDTPIPTEVPATATVIPLPTPVPTPPPTLAESLISSPWSWLVLAAFVIGLGWWLFIARRRPKPKPEKCVKCGFDMTGKPGACPQCGETRRLPRFKQ